MTCKVDGCDRDIAIKKYELCGAHYMRMRRGSDLTKPVRRHRYDPICTIDGCEKPHWWHGYCSMHGKRVLQWGNPDEVHTRKAKQCEVEGCIKNVDSWGYCGMHVWRLKRGLPLGGPETIYELRDKAIESIIDVGWAYNAEELMRMVPGDLKPRTILLRLKEEGAPESLVEKFYALERVRDNARRRERRAQKRANAKSG